MQVELLEVFKTCEFSIIYTLIFNYYYLFFKLLLYDVGRICDR